MKNYYDFDTDTIHYKGKEIKLFSEFTQQQYMKDYVWGNLIVLYVGGSHAYGINTETSDTDIRGMFRDNLDMVLGYEKIEQLENSTKDITIYAVSKALKLIIDQNPNMQETLWVEEEDILFANDTYWYLRSIRGSLLSKLSKVKYAGYSNSQFARMMGHNKWIVKEQAGKFDNKPNIKDYVLFINKSNGNVSRFDNKSRQYYFMKVKNEIYNVFWTSGFCNFPLIEEGNSFIPIREEFFSIRDYYCGVLWFNKSQFQSDLEEYNNWKRWKDNRNDTRHELEEKYGFDTKAIMHCFRLLKTGCEILEGKGVMVKRPDKEFLLDIRNGKYTYEWVVLEAEKYDKEILPKLYEESKLQHTVDPKVYVDLMKKILSGEV